MVGHFHGEYTFDLDKALYFFTAGNTYIFFPLVFHSFLGRREIENKGVDLFIEALAKLNYRLKEEGSDMTIVAFIIMPGNTNSYNVESISVCFLAYSLIYP